MPFPLIAIALGLGGAGVLGYSAYESFATPFVPPVGLAWGQKLTNEERAKTIQVGKNLQIDPSYLTAIMRAESGINSHIHITPNGHDSRGGVLYKRSSDPNDPEIDKAIGGGLIGFMRPTAKGLGTDLPTLLKMDISDQLDYVERFYANHRKSGVIPPNPSLWRVYMATFYPAKAHLADKPNAVLFDSQSPLAGERKAYFGNIGTDKDHNGVTTIGEAMNKIEGIYRAGLSSKNRY